MLRRCVLPDKESNISILTSVVHADLRLWLDLCALRPILDGNEAPQSDSEQIFMIKPTAGFLLVAEAGLGLKVLACAFPDDLPMVLSLRSVSEKTADDFKRSPSVCSAVQWSSSSPIVVKLLQQS